MAKKEPPVTLEVEDQKVRITSPSKPYFPEAGLTKLDLVNYYLAAGPYALRGIRDRPLVLRRYVDGAAGEGFFQKRAPDKRPDWIDTVVLKFPSGRSAEEIVIRRLPQLIWITNLGNIDLNPHPVRADDLEHPDELRVDLDPGPGVEFATVREVAMLVKDVLEDHGLVGWPKTSGSRGIHINVRIERRWSFDQVRRAALALAREVERRAPAIATAAWWKEERHGVFLDYNQNAKDRTVASVYSVRPTPDARVSCALRWDEVPNVDPAAFTLRTVPERLKTIGDVGAGIDEAVGSLDALLELSARQEAEGQGDAPWPPHYRKGRDEPRRVAPSRKKGAARGEQDAAKKDKAPLLVVARARTEDEAREGLERWKARHPEAAEHVAVEDVLVDKMRGRSSLWYRIRVNLRNVPTAQRPPQETPDPDYDPYGD